MSKCKINLKDDLFTARESMAIYKFIDQSTIKNEYMESLYFKDMSLEKAIKFDKTSITTDEILNLLDGEKFNKKTVESIKSKMGKVGNKINALLSTDFSKLQVNKKFVQDIYYDENVVEYNLALKLLMEEQTGEYNKLVKEFSGTSVDEISDAGMINSPLARIAPTLGRQILEARNFRILKTKKNGLTNEEVQNMYYKAGMVILEELSDKGYITLQDNGSVLNDFIHGDEVKRDYSSPTIKTAVVRLNMSSILDVDSVDDNILSLLRNESLSEEASKSKQVKAVNTLLDVSKAYTAMKQPANVSFPTLAPNYSNVDDLKTTYTAQTAKDIYTETKVSLNEHVFPLLADLARSWDNSKYTFDKWFTDQVALGNAKVLKDMFGVDTVDTHDSLVESALGRRRSKLQAMEDLLTLIAINKYKNTPTHMLYRYVKNARMHMDNTAENAQASKFIRHLITTGTYSLDLNNKVHQRAFTHLVDSLIDESKGIKKDGSKLTKKEILNEGESKELDNALKLYEKAFIKGDTKTKLMLLSMMNSDEFVDTTNSMETISVLGGIYDIRNNVTMIGDEKVLTTQYMTKPDATASGGTLTFLESVGYNEDVKKVLQDIGILKNENGDVSDNGDIYSILEDVVKDSIHFAKGGKTKDGFIDYTLVSIGKVIAPLVDEGIFDSLRDLSKMPTMTFIYNQGETGAIVTMANDIATTAIEDNKVNYMKSLLGSDRYEYIIKNNPSNLKKELVEVLSEHGSKAKELRAPAVLYKLLENKLSDKIKDRKILIEDIYAKYVDLVGVDGKVKMLPAMAVKDLNSMSINDIIADEEAKKKYRKQLKKFGMDLTKRRNVLKKVDGKDVVVMEDRVNPTSALVNTIHSLDFAGLATATVDAAINSNELDFDGIIPVHDETIANAIVNTLVQESYGKNTIDMVKRFSIEEELYKAYLANGGERDLSIEDQIKKANEAKQEILADDNLAINNTTQPVVRNMFGTDTYNTMDKDIEEFINREVKKKPSTSNKKTSSSSSKKKPKPHVLEKYKDQSSLINLFYSDLDKLNSKVINNGARFSYNAYVDSLQFNTEGLTDEEIISNVDHEITHAYTVHYIKKELAKPSDRRSVNIRYIDKLLTSTFTDNMNVTKIREKLQGTEASKAFEVLYKHTSRNNKTKAISEFVAIVNSMNKKDTELLLNTVFKAKSRPKGFVNTVITKVKELVKAINNAIFNIDNGDIFKNDIENIVKYTVITGRNYRLDAVENSKDISLTSKKNILFDSHNNTNREHYVPYGFEMVSNKAVNYLNSATYNILMANADKLASYTGNFLDTQLRIHFPLYSQAADYIKGVYDNSEELKELKHYITNFNNVDDKSMKNKVLSMILAVHKSRNTMETSGIERLTKLANRYDDKTKSKLLHLTKDIPLQFIMDRDSDLNTIDDVNDRINELESTLPNRYIIKANATVKSLVNNEQSLDSIESFYNEFDMYTPTAQNIAELVTLKALKESKLVNTYFDIKNNNKDLYEAMRDQFLALHSTVMDLHGSSDIKVHNILVKDVFETNHEFRVFNKEGSKYYEYSDNNEWKIIREATSNSKGLAVRERLDETFLEGAGTREDLGNNLFKVGGKDYNGEFDVKIGDDKFIRLTNKDKDKLDLNSNFAQHLVRSATDALSVQDTRAIRDILLQDGIHYTMRTNTLDEDIKTLDELILSETMEHPWTIKLDSGVEYKNLPQSIRNEYKPVTTKLSSIDGFNKNISLVRKDIQPWLLGKNAKSMFTSRKMKKISTILKRFIQMTKLGMITANPVKLASDMSANLTQLELLGVPLSASYAYGKEFMENIGKFNDDLTKLTSLKLKASANPNDLKIKREYEDLQETLKSNPLWEAHDNGFINSLSSDIVNSNIDAVAGLEHDLDKVFKYLTNDNKNMFAEQMMRFSNWGINGETLLRSLGEIVNANNDVPTIEEELNGIANRIADIKSRNDAVAYMHNFVLSPNSEIVKVGTEINDIGDGMMRYVYMRYLMDVEGKSKKEAVVAAIDMMPDYKANMPVGLKTLSDYDILMFPSFFLRTVKPIENIIKRKSINLGIFELTQHMLGVHVESIFDGSIYDKLLDDRKPLLHSPTDFLGVDSLFPTRVF